MNDILAQCRDMPERRFGAGEDLLREGERSGIIYILIDGSVEVLKGDVQVTTVAEPGGVFGEMSALLDAPHMATVRALMPSRFYVAENATEFLQLSPQVALAVARLLAKRLQAMTSYLVDLKQQFGEHGDHLALVDEVLETLVHHQDQEHSPGSDRDPDPTVY
jgi:CRP/FNR family transcriptional regulator, cyclic AMP receptor protein